MNKETETVKLRKASQADAAELMILDNMASHGMSLTFWQHAVDNGEGEDALEYARRRFADSSNVFGWSNAIVAEEKRLIAGSVTSYIMEVQEDDVDEIKRVFPRFVPVFELFAKVPGHWFIDGLAVYPDARNRGLAGRLVDECLSIGKAKGLEFVSLVVEDGNAPALSLYRNRNFKVTESRPFVGKDKTGLSENWLLMTKNF